jgi:hypothetical protein
MTGAYCLARTAGEESQNSPEAVRCGFLRAHAGRPVESDGRSFVDPLHPSRETMKTSQTRPLDALLLAALALSACRASVQADAQLNTGGDGKEQVRDFDRPLDPAQARAEPAADEAPTPEYALLGARHDLNYAGPTSPACQCLAVTASDSANNAAFQWELGAPQLNPSTQQVIAFTSNGVSCDAPPAGTLGASYQGYAVEGNDVVVFVEALGEGRPMTSGAIIPRPLGNGSVLVEPAGAIYGKPLEGKGKRCKIALSASPSATSSFPGTGAGKPSDKAGESKPSETTSPKQP